MKKYYLARCKPARTKEACKRIESEANSRSTSSALAFASEPFCRSNGVVTCSTKPISRSAAVLKARRCLAPIPNADISATALATAYRRFIERRLREDFGFEGTPIEVAVKVKERDDS